MLEPDKVYTLEYRNAITAPWSILATIDVTADIEGWNLDTQAAANLANAAQIRLSLANSLPAVANLLRQSTPTVVAWNEALMGIEYPATGSSFAGSYALPGAPPGTASGTLAMNLKTEARSTGGAAISTIIWYTPGSSGTPTPVRLAPSGGAVVLSRLDTRVTPAYADPCYSATSLLL